MFLFPRWPWSPCAMIFTQMAVRRRVSTSRSQAPAPLSLSLPGLCFGPAPLALSTHVGAPFIAPPPPAQAAAAVSAATAHLPPFYPASYLPCDLPRLAPSSPRIRSFSRPFLPWSRRVSRSSRWVSRSLCLCLFCLFPSQPSSPRVPLYVVSVYRLSVY